MKKWKILKKNLIFIVIFAAFILQIQLVSAWWNSSFENMTNIGILNPVGSAQTNYSLNLNISYLDGMQTDFDDLRFVDSDDATLINYWIESKIDSNSANVWIKIPKIVNDKNIYMYWGNSSATSLSNGNNTFIFFADSFDGWIVEEGDLIQGPTLYANSTTTKAYKNFTNPEILYGYEMKIAGNLTAGAKILYLLAGTSSKATGTGDAYHWHGIQHKIDGETVSNFYRVSKINETTGEVDKLGGSRSIGVDDTDQGDTWVNYTFRRTENGLYSYFADNVEYSLTAGNAGNPNTYLIGSVFDKFEFFGRLGLEAVDNIILRKYLSSEPTYYIGSLDWEEVGAVYNSSTYETSRESFTYKVIYNTTAYSSIDSTFFYGSQSYSSTEGTIGNLTSFTSAIDVVNGTNAFYWTISLVNSTGTFLFNSTFYNQTANAISFGYCGAGGVYLNFTYKDESDLSIVTSQNDLAESTYWLGQGTVNKTFSLSNTTAANSTSFCFYPSGLTLNMNMAYRYSATNYPQRTFTYQDKELTSTTTNQDIYLLSSTDGIYSSINVINSAGSVIEGVLITLERQISNVWTTIGIGETGSDGLVTFWVNPNYAHRITASKTGYVPSQVTITPSQTLYTLTMSTTAGNASYVSDIPGLRWVVKPSIGRISAGSQSFNVTVTSTEGNLENCKLELLNASDTSHVLATGTGFTNSSYCFVPITYTALENSRIFARVSVDTTATDGFVVVDTDIAWFVVDINAKSWRSITSFFEDLKTIGEFGEGEKATFSRLIFFFLTFTIIIGVFSFFTKVELSNPGITLIIVWFVALIASFGGFLTVNFGSPNTDMLIEQYALIFVFTLLIIGYILTMIRRSQE